MAMRTTRKKTAASTKAIARSAAKGARPKAQKRSRILAVVHESAKDLYNIGLIDQTTMREFDALCLPEVPNYTPRQIKGIRARCNASQAVFARYMNITTSSLQKWEIGQKKPSSVALKLLNVVDRKGLEALI